MRTVDPVEFNEALTTIISWGGVDVGGGGGGVRPSGKGFKVPPRQDLQAMPTEDEKIMQAIQVLAQHLDDEQMRTRVEQAAQAGR